MGSNEYILKLKEECADIKEAFGDYDEWGMDKEEDNTEDLMERISDREIFVDYDEWNDGQYYDYNEIDIEMYDKMIEIERKKAFDKERNIRRDKKGRLNKGAQLAKKDSCNKSRIWSLYCEGVSIKKIMTYMGCSQATAYKAIKEFKDVHRGQLF